MGHYPIMERDNPESIYPESRVLIIGTGGTICMQPSPDGLQPIGGFLESAMTPRPSFNDMSEPRGRNLAF
jgi:60kDa lysophospholipase